MAIAFRALGTTSKVSSGNMSPGLPTGHTTDDILLLFTSQQDNVICSVSGYTLIAFLNNAANCRMEIWAKRDNGAESAPTVTHTSGGVSNAVIAAYSGVTNTLTVGTGGGSIIRDVQTSAAAVTSTTSTGPALASSVISGDMRIFYGMFTVNDTSGATTNNWSTVTGFTERRDDCSALSGSWATSFAIDDLLATGAAAAVTSTCNGSTFTFTTGRNIGVQLALASTAASVAPPPFRRPTAHLTRL